METKFKVGDRVRMIDKHASYDADNGSVGTVAKKYGEGTDNNAWEIDWDPDHTGGNAYAIESQLELVHARGKKCAQLSSRSNTSLMTTRQSTSLHCRK
jgi:hypothetical protein